jgi:adenylate kinase
MSHIMLIGIQWSGKGTQARKILDQHPDYVLFEMGSELRKFAANGTPDGEHANSFIKQGLKVPTEYIVRLTEKFLLENTGKTVLIDGAIRSAEQNDALEHVWSDFRVLFLDLDEETAVARLSGRRIDPVTQETFPASFEGDINPKTGNKLVTRADDTPEAIRKRIAWSKGDTLPLIEVWKRHGHTVHRIDAADSEEVVFKQIEKILEA